MSSSLMFDDTIMGHIKRNVLSHHTSENDLYIYRGSLQDFLWRKETYECIEMPCEHLCLKKNEVKDY